MDLPEELRGARVRSAPGPPIGGTHPAPGHQAALSATAKKGGSFAPNLPIAQGAFGLCAITASTSRMNTTSSSASDVAASKPSG